MTPHKSADTAPQPQIQDEQVLPDRRIDAYSVPATYQEALEEIAQLRNERDALSETVSKLGFMVIKGKLDSDDQESAMQRLARHNTFDPETGLMKKKPFEDYVLPARILAAETGQEKPFSLVELDLTNFKAVNDTIGHAQGDVIIRNVGLAIDSSVRSSAEPQEEGKPKRLQDIVVSGETYEIEIEETMAGHLNGDHYAVLVNESDPENVQLIIDRIVAAVDESLIRANQRIAGEGLGFRVGISAGFASYRPGMTAQQMSKEAEAAMQAHKDEQHEAFGQYREV